MVFLARWLAGVCIATISVGCGGDVAAPAGATQGASSGGMLEEPAEHRPMATPCTTDRPPINGGSGSEGAGTCSSDAECTEGDSGRCIWPLPAEPKCSYDACTEDADCGSAALCACRVEASYYANVCFRGNCITDADCGTSGYCSPSA